MEASIRDSNIKHFVRLLQCAARYGDDLCMHARSAKWELAVTNSSKSAYCRFTLEPTFFSRYRPLGNKAQQQQGVKCQLYVKSVLGVLGKASSVNSVERVDLKIVDPEGGLRAPTQPNDEEGSEDDDIRVASRSAYLELRLVYRHGVTKKHHLHVQPSEFLRADVDPDSTPSGFLISAKVLRDWLDHFTIAFGSSAGGNIRGDSHLAWMFSENEVRVKNFESATTNTLATEIKIDVNEFQNYEIISDSVALALPMREFKATLQLAEQFNMDLDFAFSESSQPMTLTSRFIGLDRYGNETALFDIFCAIATTPTEAYPQSTQTNGVAKPSNRQRSMSTSVKPENGARRTDSIRTSSSRPASTRPGSARPRASLNLTGRASQFRDLPNPAGEEGDLSQQGQAEEPLFQPGPTQSSQGVRMTQQEVLELAGMGDLDMEALLGDEDADMGDEAQAANEDAPAGWEDVTADFENIPDEHMSTQRDAVAAARQKRQKPNGSGADEAVSAGTASASKLSRVEQLSRQPSINAATVKRSESSMEFKPISNMLDPGATEQRDEREDSNGTEVDEEGEVEELDEDAVDATQPSGHKFQQFFQD